MSITFMDFYNRNNSFKQIVDDLLAARFDNNMYSIIKYYGINPIYRYFKVVGNFGKDEEIEVIQRNRPCLIPNHYFYITSISELEDEIVGELASAKPLKDYFENGIITLQQFEQAKITLSELEIPPTFAENSIYTQQELYEFCPLGLAMLIDSDDFVEKLILLYSDIYVNGYISPFWKITTLKSHEHSGIPDLNLVLLMEHRHLEKSVETYVNCQIEWITNDLDDLLLIGQED